MMSLEWKPEEEAREDRRGKIRRKKGVRGWGTFLRSNHSAGRSEASRSGNQQAQVGVAGDGSMVRL